MIKVSDILTNAGFLLEDVDHDRWSPSELISWLNDAINELAIRRPPAFSEHTVLTLTEGARQQLPDNSNVLLDVIMNLPSMRAVTRVDRKLMARMNPEWFAMTPSDVIKHFMYDDKDTDKFYVYPPAQEGTQLEILHVKVPTVTSIDDTIPTQEQYRVPLLNYIMWRSLSKDSELGAVNLAVSYFQAFNEAIGTNNTISMVVSPNQREQG